MLLNNNSNEKKLAGIMNRVSILKLACLATSLLASALANAQQEPTPDTIIVTGSRIVTNANSPTPVTMVDTEELSFTTPSNLPSALNKLPVFIGSQSSNTRTLGGARMAQVPPLTFETLGFSEIWCCLMAIALRLTMQTVQSIQMCFPKC